MKKNELSNKVYSFQTQSRERPLLVELGKLAGSQSNAIRRGLRLLAEQEGYDLPEWAFVERQKGNRTVKKVKEAVKQDGSNEFI